MSRLLLSGNWLQHPIPFDITHLWILASQRCIPNSSFVFPLSVESISSTVCDCSEIPPNCAPLVDPTFCPSFSVSGTLFSNVCFLYRLFYSYRSRCMNVFFVTVLTRLNGFSPFSFLATTAVVGVVFRGILESL